MHVRVDHNPSPKDQNENDSCPIDDSMENGGDTCDGLGGGTNSSGSTDPDTCDQSGANESADDNCPHTDEQSETGDICEPTDGSYRNDQCSIGGEVGDPCNDSKTATDDRCAAGHGHPEDDCDTDQQGATSDV